MPYSMLEKEKKISDSVKELRKQLVEREYVLYTFDEYENIKKEIDKLRSEIDLIKKTPISGSLDNIVGDTNVYLLPHLFEEVTLNCFKVRTHRDTYIASGNPPKMFRNEKEQISSLNIDVIPKSGYAYNQYVISDAFKGFLIDVREKMISHLENRMNKLLANIDSELENIN